MQQLLPVVIAMGIALMAVLLLRRLLARHLPVEKAAEAERVLPFLIGTIGGYYGLLTGFVLSSVWGDVQMVRSAAMQEVNAMFELERIAEVLPPSVAHELTRGVDTYLRSVIEYDMSAMARGEVSGETTDAYRSLWMLVAQPRTGLGGPEAALLGRALDKVEQIGEQRRIRILVSGEPLPPMVWAILLLGGAIILYGSSVVSLRYGRPAVEVLAAVAAMLTVVLITIYTMDRPFGHGLTLGADHYRSAWELLNPAPGAPRP